MAQERPALRLAFVDVARGLAVVLMLQTHAYDAWLRPELRQTEFFRWSQLIGGLPGAFFLLLMGLSVALGGDGSRRRGAGSRELARRGLGRSAMLLGVAFLFRVTMYLASDRPEIESIFRVDILNCLAVSMALLTLLEFMGGREGRLLVAVCSALWFAIATPMVWDGGLLDGAPNRLAGYLSGRVANSSFPLFPWASYAFAGYAVGTIIGAARDRAMNRSMAWLFGLGLAMMPLSVALDGLPTFGPRYDYWWTSPNFVMFKTAVLLLLVVACFGFDRLRQGAVRFQGYLIEPAAAALIQMGRTSLFIYCVHVDIVYGSRALPKLWRSCEIGEATRNLAVLTLAMLALSYGWTWGKARVSSLVRSQTGAITEGANG
jgi:uncharacterized membrane protein